MNVRTQYLVKKAVRWLWLALLVGVLCAVGFRVLGSRAAAETEPSAVPAAPEDPALDVRLARFAMLSPDFSADAEDETEAAEPETLGRNEYAASLSEYAAARFLTDVSYWHYYNTLLAQYPALDHSVFTSDMMRAMISIWQYHYDVIVRVMVPEADGAQLDAFAEALGVTEDKVPEGSSLRSVTQCRLRDALFAIVSDYVSDPAVQAREGLKLRRADAAAEKEMALQSIIVAEADAGLAAEVTGHTVPGRKMLLLVFLLGFALTEALVLGVSMLDETLRAPADLEANADLPLLGVIKAAAPDYTEPALRLLAGKAKAGELALAALREDAPLQEAAAALTKAMHGDVASGDAVACAGCAAKWDAALQAAADRRVILLVEAGKTNRKALAKAAGILRALQLEPLGAIFLEP